LSLKPHVSVIVPVFNNPEALAECIDTLYQQSYPADQFEIVVVDNASMPPLSLSRQHSPTLTTVRCLTPGAYAARNAGVQVARGDILVFIDSDCLAESDWIASGVNALTANPDAVVGGEVAMLPPEAWSAVAYYQYLVGFFQQKNIEEKGFSATANLFCRRQQFMVVGGFDESLYSGGDREWCWRARHAGYGIVYAPAARVLTSARVTLAAAIRQARRIAGGRRALAQRGLPETTPSSSLRPHLSALEAAHWILSHPELNRLQRLQVFMAAAVIRLSSVIEHVRLAAGYRAERR
jgi:glycosyltransferase involved in cell wall biosynthesis